MEVGLLGPLEVRVDGRPVEVGVGKRRSLLALLALHANEVLPADRLIEELWGEQPPSTAAKGLQVQVSHLRRDLRSNGSAEILKTRGHGYLVELDADALDVHRFERALEEGRGALEAGDAEGAARLLREALALWRGPPLADFTYEAFAQQPIARLDELRLVALERRIEADLQLGHHADVAGELEELVREHPLRERLRGLLMLALYRCGRQADALDAYRSGRLHLTEELGLEPAPELRRLERQILEQSPELDLPARPPPPAPPTARRPAWRYAVPAIALVVAVVVAAVLLAGDADPPARAAISLENATNALVRLDADGLPDVAVSLPGRTFDVAADARTIWAVTIRSDSISAVDSRTGTTLRTIPLRLRPEAVAIGTRGVWIADGIRRLLARIPSGYQDVTEPVRYRSGAPGAPRGARELTSHVSLAVAGGAIWIADGSRRLVRIDERTGASRRVDAGVRASALATGAGALWAVSAEDAAVVRISPASGSVTGRAALVGRRVGRTPFPATVAATPADVWVLNGNTATLTRLDPRSVSVVATVKLGLDRVPSGLAADASAAWVANGDGSVSRVDAEDNAVRSIWIGRALRDIVIIGGRPWVVTTA